MAELTIRAAAAGDVPVIGAIAIAAGQEDDWSGRNPAYVQHLMRHARLLVAASGGQVTGFGATQQIGSGAAAVTMLCDLFVHPDAHGRGIGRALLAELWDLATPPDDLQQHARARAAAVHELRPGRLVAAAVPGRRRPGAAPPGRLGNRGRRARPRWPRWSSAGPAPTGARITGPGPTGRTAAACWWPGTARRWRRATAAGPGRRLRPHAPGYQPGRRRRGGGRRGHRGAGRARSAGAGHQRLPAGTASGRAPAAGPRLAGRPTWTSSWRPSPACWTRAGRCPRRARPDPGRAGMAGCSP